MDQTAIAADIAQALFYTVGAVAVVVGGVVGWLRFAREQPDAPRWDITIAEPRVRYQDEEYRYTVELLVTNQSRSSQSLNDVWLRIVHPDFGLGDQPADRAEATEYFGEPQRGRRMPPSSSLTFGRLDDIPSEPTVVCVEYALDVGEPSLIIGRIFKPVHHEDLRMYRGQ